MAYITNKIFIKIIDEIYFKTINQLNYDRQVFIKDFDLNINAFKILNNVNIDKLFIIRGLLQNEKEFFAKYHNIISPIQDTFEFAIYKGGILNYHLFKDCNSMYNDFFDLVIPDEVRKNDKVKEFRKWVINNNFKQRYINTKNLHSNNRNIVRKYNLEFAKINNLPEIHVDFKFIIEADNSGNLGIKKRDYSNEIEKLISERNDLLKGNSILEKISKFDYLHNKSPEKIENTLNTFIGKDITKIVGKDAVFSFWIKHSNIRNQLFLKLIDYLKLINGYEDKIFSHKVLKFIGLKCCTFCKERFIEESQTKANQTI